MDVFLEKLGSWALDNGPFGVCLLAALYIIKWLMSKMINGFNDNMSNSIVALKLNKELLDRIEPLLERISKKFGDSHV